jgi:hypothetical protein
MLYLTILWAPHWSIYHIHRWICDDCYGYYPIIRRGQVFEYADNPLLMIYDPRVCFILMADSVTSDSNYLHDDNHPQVSKVERGASKRRSEGRENTMIM